LKQAARELLDGSLRAFVGRGLDERESARSAGVTVEGDADASHLDSFSCERLPELLLVDVIRKIADEKTSTHREFLRTRAG
jgi:hypothetical protein